ENTLVVAISQSGETIDTIAAMKEARAHGAHVLAVTNVMGSQATRDCDSVLYTRAGLEVGVAASKTFTSQVVLMYLLALKLGIVRGTIDATRAETLLAQVRARGSWSVSVSAASGRRRSGCPRSPRAPSAAA